MIANGRNALVFDLDGTLVDSAPDIAAAANAVLAEAGRPLLSLPEVRSMVGDGMATLVARLFASTGWTPAPNELARLVERFREAYEARATRETCAFEGVPETLGALQGAGFRMAVCTNKPQRPAAAILEALGLSHYFAAVVGPERAPARKPDPRHLGAALAAIGAEPRQAVMVGDGRNDIAVARGLGVPVIAVAFGYPGGAGRGARRRPPDRALRRAAGGPDAALTGAGRAGSSPRPRRRNCPAASLTAGVRRREMSAPGLHCAHGS